MTLRNDVSVKCIFYSFKQAFRTFSTASPRLRKSSGAYHKRIRVSNGRSGRRSESEDAPLDGLLVGSYHKSFNPYQGQSFDRKSITGVRGDDITGRVEQQLAALEGSLHTDPTLSQLQLSKDKLERQFNKFRQRFALPSAQAGRLQESLDPLLERVRRLAALRDERGIDHELKYAFYATLAPPSLKQSDLQYQKHLLNLQYPSEWYPRTRGIHRVIHIHVGPTNSGKTYHALKRLEGAESGVYAGPLRLLAHEVYMRLNARGKRCNLVTGDEIRKTEGDGTPCRMMSCTVEMVPLNEVFDVAVIDEIQMLGSEDRGWAWTQALLGVMAREVHVCGEERAVPIIEELAAACGETVKVHRYERLSPLRMMPKSLEGDLNSLQKGDCIVGFSIVVLHSLRQYVEQMTGKKCAIIYGSLPPETRTQQASLFNDPDNDYDYLVASNAVGMGLNLSIKRLIFQSAHKNIRGRLEAVSVPEIKQIAGRAGRYSTASQDMKASTDPRAPLTADDPEASIIPPTDVSDGAETDGDTSKDTNLLTVEATTDSMNASKSNAPSSGPLASKRGTEPSSTSKPKTLGLVTTLERLDYPIVAKAMVTDPVPMTSAGVLPPSTVIEEFARYYPTGTPLSFLFLRLKEIAGTSHRFFLCDIKNQISIADAIESVPGLSIAERLEFCAAPIEPRKEGEPELARAYATMVGDARPANVLDIKELDIELLEEEYEANREYLRRLEGLHRGLIIFNWLAYRFTGVFQDQELAAHVKELVERRIEETLGKMSFDYRRMRKTRDQALLDLLEDKEDASEPEKRKESLEVDEGSSEENTSQTVETDAGLDTGMPSNDASMPSDISHSMSAHDDISLRDGVSKVSGHPPAHSPSDKPPQARGQRVPGMENLPDWPLPDSPATSA